MTDSVSPGGFVERIQDEANAEAQAVLADLERLRFRADQVLHVLRALHLPIPEGLDGLRALAPIERVPPAEPVEPEPVEPPAPPARPAPRGPVEQALESRSRVESAIRAIADRNIGKLMPAPSVIAAQVGVNAPTVRTILERLVTDGYLVRVGDHEFMREAPVEAPPPPSPPATTAEYSPQQRAVLDLYQANPDAVLTAQQVGERLNTSTESVRRALEVLRENGALAKHSTMEGTPPRKRVMYSLPSVTVLPDSKSAPPEPAPPSDIPPGDSVPPELSDMPVIRGRTTFETSNLRVQALNTAREQKRVADLLATGGDYTSSEVAIKLAMTKGSAARYISDLLTTGHARITGDMRDQSPVYAQGNGVPFPEELPPYLDGMPVAELGIPFPNKYTIATQQRRVLDAARLIGKPFVIAEFPSIDMPRTRVRQYLVELAEQGKYIRTTGKMRRAKGQVAGRTAVEFEVIDTEGAPKPPKAAPAPPKTAPTGSKAASSAKAAPQLLSQQETLNQLRTALRKKEGEDVSATWLAEEIERATEVHVPVATVIKLLEALVKSGGGSVKARGENDQRRYRFERSSDPGPAARIEQERRRKSGSRAVSEPVPGTGRGPKAAHADVQALLNTVVRLVGRDKVTQAANGHWAVECPNGKRVMISSTPSNPRSLLADRARLRRIGGLDIPS